MSGDKYGSWEESINAVTKGLKDGYVGQGLTSVSDIQKKYCPEGAANDPTGLNSAWAGNVSRFYAEQGGNPKDVTSR
jgi:hypothetical protein